VKAVSSEEERTSAANDQPNLPISSSLLPEPERYVEFCDRISSANKCKYSHSKAAVCSRIHEFYTQFFRSGVFANFCGFKRDEYAEIGKPGAWTLEAYHCQWRDKFPQLWDEN